MAVLLALAAVQRIDALPPETQAAICAVMAKAEALVAKLGEVLARREADVRRDVPVGAGPSGGRDGRNEADAASAGATSAWRGERRRVRAGPLGLARWLATTRRVPAPEIG